jgi:hypothetical protein
MAAPAGNSNHTKGRIWKQAIERALEARGAGDRVAALNALAEKLLAKADEGDMSALKELGDRLDGKSAQSVTVSGDEDAPLVTRIERIIVHAANQDRSGI